MHHPSYILLFLLPFIIISSFINNVNGDELKSSFKTLIFQETQHRFRVSIRHVNKPDDVVNYNPIVSRMIDETRTTTTTTISNNRREHSIITPADVSMSTSQRLTIKDPTGHELATITISQLSIPLISNTKSYNVNLHFSQSTTAQHWGGGIGSPSHHIFGMNTASVKNKWLTFPTVYYPQVGFSLFFVIDGEDDIPASSDSLNVGAFYPVSFSIDNIISTISKTSSWKISTSASDITSSFDMYVMFASTSMEATSAYFELTGQPRIPPIWALGFLASRWGWKDYQYMEDVLDEFDFEGIPIDAFIMDFEWYLNSSLGDYAIPPQGVDGYPDFTFGNDRTFPDPYAQGNEYRERNVLMGGIRKPRLGDSTRIKSATEKGWMLRPGKSRDLNFSKPEVREWYAQNQAGNFQSLPMFWWNDEGESHYFTYHDWIRAQQLEKPDITATLRRFSLSRSFTPGMQRLEAAAMWTGDVPSSWSSLRNHVGILVEYGEAGIPLISMDIGGFVGISDPSPALLARWYQLGVFAGVMRVHSELLQTPHFPFSSLWGFTAAKAMHGAIRLRYSFLPTIYSLLHHAIPLVQRTSVCDIHGDLPCFSFANQTMIVYPLLAENSTRDLKITLPCDEENSNTGTIGTRYYPFPHGSFGLAGHVCQVILPSQEWTSLSNPFPMFMKSGSLLLTFDDVNTFRLSELINARKTVTVHIFPGSDAESLELVEDDGISLNGGNDGIRRTKFIWNDQEQILTWVVSGDNSAPRWYSRVLGRLYGGDGSVLERIGNLAGNSVAADSGNGMLLRMKKEEEVGGGGGGGVGNSAVVIVSKD
jgi:alpha-glucosidase